MSRIGISIASESEFLLLTRQVAFGDVLSGDQLVLTHAIPT